MRLIDANALVESILEERAKIPLTVPAAPYEIVKEKPYEHGNSMRGGIRKALRCVANAPTVEAAPVVRGKWILLAENSTGCIYQCTNCGKFNNPNKKDVAKGRAEETPRFCSRCGAKMDFEGGGYADNND